MATFKIRDKETGEVFTIRDKEKGINPIGSNAQQSAPVVSDEKVGGIFGIGAIPASEYAKGERNLAGNIFERPAAAVRGAILNPANPIEGYVKGSVNPATIPTFRDEFLKKLGGTNTYNNYQIANVGSAVDTLTNPADLLMSLAGNIKAPTPRPGSLAIKSKALMKQAEEMTTHILQPTTSDLAEAISKGRQLPSIRRGAENISSAKTFEDVVKHLKTTTKELFEERNMILDQYNTSIGDEALSSLDELAKSSANANVMRPGQLKQIDNVFFREAEYLSKNPNMDIITAQARKEQLQTLTRQLLEKRRAGTLTGAENVELQAYDALRNGYRKAILNALPKDKAILVDKINSKYEGLLDATELASIQAAKGMKEVPKTLIEKVANSFGLSPKYTAFRLATKEFAGLTGKTQLERTTSKIAELRNRSEALKTLAKMANKARLK